MRFTGHLASDAREKVERREEKVDREEERRPDAKMDAEPRFDFARDLRQAAGDVDGNGTIRRQPTINQNPHPQPLKPNP